MSVLPFDFVAPVGLSGGKSSAASFDIQLMKLAHVAALLAKQRGAGPATCV